MKRNIISIFIFSALVITCCTTQAQVYRTAATEVLENNGKEWIEKKLPSSVITFSDYSGEVEVKTIINTLSTENDSLTNPDFNFADFKMILDKDQLPEQIAGAKTFTTTGLLTINNISKKITAQYSLAARNAGNGYLIDVIIRFNPPDFNVQLKDEQANEPIIVKVTNGYLNKQANNF